MHTRIASVLIGVTVLTLATAGLALAAAPSSAPDQEPPIGHFTEGCPVCHQTEEPAPEPEPASDPIPVLAHDPAGRAFAVPEASGGDRDVGSDRSEGGHAAEGYDEEWREPSEHEDESDDGAESGHEEADDEPDPGEGRDDEPRPEEEPLD